MNDFNLTTGGLKSNYDTHTLLNSGNNLKYKLDQLQTIVSKPKPTTIAASPKVISSQPKRVIHPNTTTSTVIQQPRTSVRRIQASSTPTVNHNVATPSRRVIERRDSRGNILPPMQGSAKHIIGTPQGARVSNRRPSTPGSVTKYYRVDENGQRVEIDPPTNGNFRNLTPSR